MMNIEDVLKGHGIGAGGGSNIKSIQRGSFAYFNTTSSNVTITSVDVSKSILIFTFNPTQNVARRDCIAGNLLNSATINFSTYEAVSSAQNIEWVVVEFKDVKSLQRGTTSLTNYPQEININTVDINKSLVFISQRSNDNLGTAIRYLSRVTLESNKIIITHSANEARWQVIEFK